MRICILTSHNPRHFHFANRLALLGDEVLVVSSAMGLNPAIAGHHGAIDHGLISYFEERFKTELAIYPDRYFKVPKGGVLVVGPKEINEDYVQIQVSEFNPELILVFGTNILKGNLLKLPALKLNMHLGLSPYFNGTSSNFWPMFQEKFEYVGVTIQYLDAGIDTGNIIGQVRAEIDYNDNPHIIGNKNILAGIELLELIIPWLRKNTTKGIKQWISSRWPIYKMKDFNNEIQNDFLQKLNSGIVNKWKDSNCFEIFDIVKFCSNNGPEITTSEFLTPIVVKLK